MSNTNDIRKILNQPFGKFNDKHEYIEACENAILDWHKAEVQRIIGEDEKIRWDDYKDNVALSQAVNDLRAEQRKRAGL